MADDRLTFAWELTKYQDLPTTTLSPAFELAGCKFVLKLYPHDTSPQLWLAVSTLKDDKPHRIKVSCKLTPDTDGLMRRNVVMFKTGSAAKFNVPKSKYICDNGNVLTIQFTIEVAPREDEGTVGEILVIGSKRKREGEEDSNPRVKEQDEETAMPTCNICFVNTINAVYTPCNHMGSCFECAGMLHHKRCPYCNVHFKEVLKVYMP